MNELAFNLSGESFEVPATATGWRVRRMKPRGAPELVYGVDGRPLTISADADFEELREAVGGVAARYRLDAINDDGKAVEGVPAAYVQVTKLHQDEGGVPVARPLSSGASDDTLREAMRLNTELAKSVVDRFGDMMNTAKAAIEREPLMLEAAARFLTGAHATRIFDRSRLAGGDDHDDEAHSGTSEKSASMLITVLSGVAANVLEQAMPRIEQAMPRIGQALMEVLSGKGLSLSSALNWHAAHEEGRKERQRALAESAAEESTITSKRRPKTEPAPTPREPAPPRTQERLAHLLAIESALGPDDAARARQLGSELAPGEMAAWMEQLATMSIAEAVAKVRSTIGPSKKGGAA
ncbi:MAG: hypothetical protein KIT31_16245 [Deltaproteobacteria bacterium]|nr:hypothetical protein [Deltaproteobacteria bacterium]